MRAAAARLVTSAAALLLALPVAQPVSAAPPAAEVEGLQSPAWLVRDGTRAPLAPGSRLRKGDEIDTGDGSRALLRLTEGSMVKLGENARFKLDDMVNRGRGSGELFSATLNVLRGAFRFTTTTLYKYRGQRDVQVRFTTVTVGIRGTDLWGKSTAERDIIALIEGKITLTRAGEEPVEMSRAKTLYQAPNSARALPIEPIAAEQLSLYAAETELAAGRGVLGKGGRWRVDAVKTGKESEALTVYNRLREAGYPAEITRSIAGGTRVYRVSIMGLLSETDSTAVAVKLKAEQGLEGVSVSLH